MSSGRETVPAFDTSALLPLFNAQHPHYGRAKAQFEAADMVVLHPSVITEFTTVMRRLAKDKGLDGNEKARQALMALLRQPRVAIRADMDYEAVVDRYLCAPGISFTDAVVAASVAHFNKSKPVTFDKKLGKLRAPTAKVRARRRKALESSLADW